MVPLQQKEGLGRHMSKLAQKMRETANMLHLAANMIEHVDDLEVCGACQGERLIDGNYCRICGGKGFEKVREGRGEKG